ncbi:hypothetical protein BCR32DRAFT_288254 [Anaeromyces robustus]|uniref:AMP-dependent synthetase/ligase domain-containing protein n=1 Tax=Anaeromyces robustus TaxID=1754192 RepID=A0A1Y1V482_9FUNG|nr:hypothetical protein BCR32DRAFT_288254 [Anaeromyces robustus]|eukprot:ORX46255.1 hypothetical protein BCR32DRAFT_288254 [Anaeromyces robustus]
MLLTISYINNNEDSEIKETTFAKRFLQTAEEKKDKPILIFYTTESNDEPIRLTYGELLVAINKVATGDVVGLYLPNCLPYVVVEGAIESCGLIMFQLNPTYTSDQLNDEY